ncbi:Flotillin-2 [Frankliniella fusca]|uniref:Flotillin-2 n=1 Tax=Frankliniella fusca TaxID=407009 RepID=A0AAE1GTE7_9NEOP|nr:Flotillin-2 [Frankliniella fusca]
MAATSMGTKYAALDTRLPTPASPVRAAGSPTIPLMAAKHEKGVASVGNPPSPMHCGAANRKIRVPSEGNPPTGVHCASAKHENGIQTVEEKVCFLAPVLEPLTPLLTGGCCGSTTKRTIVGGWAWAWWLVTDVQYLSLEVMTLNPMCEMVETAQGVPLTVTGVAQCKIMKADELLQTASEQFLGKSVKEIKSTVLQTLEGHLRAILVSFNICSVEPTVNGVTLDPPNHGFSYLFLNFVTGMNAVTTTDIPCSR